MNLRKFNAFLLVGVLLATACQDNKGNADPCSNNFNQQELYASLAVNLIIPLYDDLQNRIDDLDQKVKDFNDFPSSISLAILRSTWKEAYLSWQRTAPFEFGPAETVFLRNSLNNFPVNAGQVDQNISSGTYNLDNPEAYDKGFPALDYLLHDGDDATIISRFSSGPLAANYRKYLSDIVADMKDRVDQTVEGWGNGGYRDIFVENTGVAAGSSLSLIVNNLNEHYEMIKRDRIGIPSGVVTLGFTNPDKVEAFYSGISAELALEALRWNKRFYIGQSAGGSNGPGLDDFLNFIKAEKNGKPLDIVIQEQYDAAIQALNVVNDPLSEAVDNDNDTVVKAYNELTAQVVNLKTDMPAALCVSITYIDNPSDSD